MRTPVSRGLHCRVGVTDAAARDVPVLPHAVLGAGRLAAHRLLVLYVDCFSYLILVFVCLFAWFV